MHNKPIHAPMHQFMPNYLINAAQLPAWLQVREKVGPTGKVIGAVSGGEEGGGRTELNRCGVGGCL